MKNTFYLLILLLTIMGNLEATTYYVDSEGGHDTDSGITFQTAWQHISKVNNYIFQPNDIVSFKRGIDLLILLLFLKATLPIMLMERAKDQLSMQIFLKMIIQDIA
jgi:hypothetical protein